MTDEELKEAILALVDAQTWEELKQVINIYRDILLTDSADRALTTLVEMSAAGGDSESSIRFEIQRTLLEYCRREGIEAAFANHIRPPEAVIKALEAFVNAGTWEESKEIVLNNPDEVFSYAFNQVFDDFFTQYEHDESMLRYLEEHRALLAHCRQESIEAAFADFSGPKKGIPHAVSDEVLTLVEDLLRLNDTNDMPKRVDMCRMALSLVNSELQPNLWAILQKELAFSLTMNPVGDRADNIEQAILHFQLALEVHTRELFADEWAIIQQNLGRAYNRRILGDRADNLEEAIRCYDRALEVHTRNNAPDQWAELQNGLGMVYGQRIHGERADNLEQAILHFQQALEVYSRFNFPIQWAKLQHNLGIAYGTRLRGDQADNLEQAIRCYQRAIEVRTKETSPEHWAQTQVALGNAYENRTRGEVSTNLERAIEHYRQALEVYTQKTFPIEWAATLTNMSSTYHQRRVGDRKENIERAIKWLQEALIVYSRNTFPERWANVQHALAEVYRDRISEERGDNLQQAIIHYRQALEVRTPEHFPSERQRTLIGLGSLYFEVLNWREALVIYTEAIKIGERLLATAYTEVGRKTEVSEIARVYAEAAYCFLQLEQPAEAFLYLERGKAHLLAEALELSEVIIARLPAAQQRNLLEARHLVRTLEAQMRLLEPSDQLNYTMLGKELKQARVDLNRLLEPILAQSPEFMPIPLNLPDILILIPENGALVAPLVTSQGSVAFILPHGVKTVTQSDVTPLEKLDLDILITLLMNPDRNAGYFSLYATQFYGGLLQEWMSTVESFTSQLWEILLGPIHIRLRELELAEGSPVMLLPHGMLGLLPLHAAWREVDGVKRTFLDEYTVSYAPSVYALNISRQRLDNKERQRNTLLSVVNPTAEPDLPYTILESEAIENMFAPSARRKLEGSQATLEAVIHEVPSSTYLHFACHGFCNWQNVMQSGLIMAEGIALTLSDVITMLDLSKARLVVLSACETGLIEVGKAIDEYIGLPAGFLQAGASAVLSTLWEVNDLSTALLMEEFYRRHLIENQGIAEALRGGQLWLRTLTRDELLTWVTAVTGATKAKIQADGKTTDSDWWLSNRLEAFREAQLEDYDPEECPFAHPFYWAAFIASGAV